MTNAGKLVTNYNLITSYIDKFIFKNVISQKDKSRIEDKFDELKDMFKQVVDISIRSNFSDKSQLENIYRNIEDHFYKPVIMSKEQIKNFSELIKNASKPDPLDLPARIQNLFEEIFSVPFVNSFSPKQVKDLQTKFEEFQNKLARAEKTGDLGKMIYQKYFNSLYNELYDVADRERGIFMNPQEEIEELNLVGLPIYEGADELIRTKYVQLEKDYRAINKIPRGSLSREVVKELKKKAEQLAYKEIEDEFETSKMYPKGVMEIEKKYMKNYDEKKTMLKEFKKKAMSEDFNKKKIIMKVVDSIIDKIELIELIEKKEEKRDLTEKEEIKLKKLKDEEEEMYRKLEEEFEMSKKLEEEFDRIGTFEEIPELEKIKLESAFENTKELVDKEVEKRLEELMAEGRNIVDIPDSEIKYIRKESKKYIYDLLESLEQKGELPERNKRKIVSKTGEGKPKRKAGRPKKTVKKTIKKVVKKPLKKQMVNGIKKIISDIFDESKNILTKKPEIIVEVIEDKELNPFEVLGKGKPKKKGMGSHNMKNILKMKQKK
jgi:hypothetical protein